MAAALCFGASTAIAQPNVIVNGDFAAGNTGFQTDYQFATINTVEGQYTISANPHGFNSSFVNPPAPTAMMVVNGATVAGLRVWVQTVNFDAGTYHRIALDGFTAVAGGPAILQFKVNGVAVGTPVSLPATPGTWLTVEAIWFAPGITTAVIEIADLNTSTFPNDFYIDNITMRAVRVCGSADYNNDGDVGTDADIEAYFACLGGDCCATCPNDPDFDGDGDVGTDADIEAFFRVLAGGTC